MRNKQVSVVIPTLASDAMLLECLAALRRQTFRDFEVIVIDNSGDSRVRKLRVEDPFTRVMEQDRNVGFGAAVNAGFRASDAPFLATLNDDACPEPEWLASLVCAMELHDAAGMCASRIRLSGTGTLDSAGMLLCGDGSSKQRGHRASPGEFREPCEVLFPSACAALYRRNMLAEIGFFDEEFFLYCEDTDLGLRARWSGWKCLYVPEAVVEHRYSYSAGRVSPLKAYLVERNRLRMVVKNFPARMMWRVPFFSIARYFWHAITLWNGTGAASEFGREGNPSWLLPVYVLRAHLALIPELAKLLRARRSIRGAARIGADEFSRLAAAHAISVREVAAL